MWYRLRCNFMSLENITVSFREWPQYHLIPEVDGGVRLTEVRFLKLCGSWGRLLFENKNEMVGGGDRDVCV